MKSILLVRPDYNPAVSRVKKWGDTPFTAGKSFMVPLDLATVAALTPDDIEVEIWDEAVSGPLTDNTELKSNHDLIGVTGYLHHGKRIRQLGEIFRRRGIPVAVGGPGVSSSPELFREDFDVLFIGEAEHTWPQFIRDWRAGDYRPEYRQLTKPSLDISPIPRWECVNTDMTNYVMGGVQTTRGCPFDCEFCDVIYIFGRQPRHKTIDQVLEEVEALERLGLENIFFCDDNFFGNPRYARELLKELIPLNRSFSRPVAFNTQTTLNIAKDDEMLELLSDANVNTLLIGIETPNIDSLIEANKPINYRTDILADVKKIQSYGLFIRAGIIVGFDNDDTSIFRQQYEFLQEACITNAFINVLKAPRGTKLWTRLHKEGRILDTSPLVEAGLNEASPAVTNIVPEKLTIEELLTGYKELLEKFCDWRAFEARVKGLVENMRPRPREKRVTSPPRWGQILQFLKFLFFYADREARGTMLRLLVFTLRRSPFLLRSVGNKIAVQYIQAANMENRFREADYQIHLASREETRLRPEKIVFLVPESFRKPYRALFPELHERVHRGLLDKSRTDEALAEVVYDFLTRWGATFRQLEDHHHTYLHEICDRTVANENRAFPGTETLASTETPTHLPTPAPLESARRRLADEILRSVEQDLRSFQPPLGSSLETQPELAPEAGHA